MHSPAEPDPLRSCPGRPGPPSPARVEHAFDGLCFGVSRDTRVRAYPIYAPISPIASASLARPYVAPIAIASDSMALAYRRVQCRVCGVCTAVQGGRFLCLRHADGMACFQWF